MPVFDMQCNECGATYIDKYFNSLRAKERFSCERCRGNTSTMPPTNIYINMDSTCEGYDPVMEVHLRGNSHRKQEMAIRGWREKGDTPTSRTDRGKWV